MFSSIDRIASTPFPAHPKSFREDTIFMEKELKPKRYYALFNCETSKANESRATSE
jgi:hypothetical protein